MRQWFEYHGYSDEAAIRSMLYAGLDSPKRLRFATRARLLAWGVHPSEVDRLFSLMQEHATFNDDGPTQLGDGVFIGDWLTFHDMGRYTAYLIDIGWISSDVFAQVNFGFSSDHLHASHLFKLMFIATIEPNMVIDDTLSEIDPARYRFVVDWLKASHLFSGFEIPELAQRLLSIGVDSKCRFPYLNHKLLKSVGVPDKGVRAQMLARCSLKNGEFMGSTFRGNQNLDIWLQEHELEEYKVVFESWGFKLPGVITGLYREYFPLMGITKPAVQRQLLHMAMETRLENERPRSKDEEIFWALENVGV